MGRRPIIIPRHPSQLPKATPKLSLVSSADSLAHPLAMMDESFASHSSGSSSGSGSSIGIRRHGQSASSSLSSNFSTPEKKKRPPRITRKRSPTSIVLPHPQLDFIQEEGEDEEEGGTVEASTPGNGYRDSTTNLRKTVRWGDGRRYPGASASAASTTTGKRDTKKTILKSSSSSSVDSNMACMDMFSHSSQDDPDPKRNLSQVFDESVFASNYSFIQHVDESQDCGHIHNHNLILPDEAGTGLLERQNEIYDQNGDDGYEYHQHVFDDDDESTGTFREMMLQQERELQLWQEREEERFAAMLTTSAGSSILTTSTLERSLEHKEKHSVYQQHGLGTATATGTSTATSSPKKSHGRHPRSDGVKTSSSLSCGSSFLRILQVAAQNRQTKEKQNSMEMGDTNNTSCNSIVSSNNSIAQNSIAQDSKHSNPKTGGMPVPTTTTAPRQSLTQNTLLLPEDQRRADLARYRRNQIIHRSKQKSNKDKKQNDTNSNTDNSLNNSMNNSVNNSMNNSLNTSMNNSMNNSIRSIKSNSSKSTNHYQLVYDHLEQQPENQEENQNEEEPNGPDPTNTEDSFTLEESFATLDEELQSLRNSTLMSTASFKLAESCLSNDLVESNELVKTLQEQLAEALEQRELCLERYELAKSKREKEKELTAIKTLHLEILASCAKNERAKSLLLERHRHQVSRTTVTTKKPDPPKPKQQDPKDEGMLGFWRKKEQQQKEQQQQQQQQQRHADHNKENGGCNRATLGADNSIGSISVPSTSPGVILAGSRYEKNREHQQQQQQQQQPLVPTPPKHNSSVNGSFLSGVYEDPYVHKSVEELRTIKNRLEAIKDLFDKARYMLLETSQSKDETLRKEHQSQVMIETAASKYILFRSKNLV